MHVQSENKVVTHINTKFCQKFKIKTCFHIIMCHMSMCMSKKYRILLLPTFKGAKLGGAWVTIDCTFYIQFDLFSTIALPAKW